MRYFCLAWAACLAIFVARDIDAILKPVLWVEDSVAIFQFFYNLTGAIPPLRFWGGYVSLTTDIIGYFVSLFPTRWQPHMLPALAMVVSSASFAAFAAPVFRRIVQSDIQRTIVSIALAALPIGDFAAVGLVGYSQWPTGFALCLLVAAGPRLSGRGGAWLVPLMAIMIWTNPASVLLVPFLAHEAWVQREDRWSCTAYVLLIVAVALYVTVGRDYAPAEINVEKGTIDGTRLFLERGVFETVFGTIARMAVLTRWHWTILDLAAVAVLITVALAVRQRARDNGAFLIFTLRASILALAICYLSALLRPDVGLPSEWGRRYAFIPGALFAVVALVALTDVLARIRIAGRVTVGAVAIVAVVALNHHNNWLYKSPSQHWPRFRGFIKEIVAAEKAGETRTLRLEGQEREGWPITIHVRPRS